MSWGQWGRVLVAAVVLGWVLLAPPTFRVESTGDTVSCQSLGTAWREPVDLADRLPSDQLDAVEHVVAEVPGTDLSAAADRLRAACRDARQDRQTLLIVVLAVVIGALVIDRTRPRRSGSRPAAEQGAAPRAAAATKEP